MSTSDSFGNPTSFNGNFSRPMRSRGGFPRGGFSRGAGRPFGRGFSSSGTNYQQPWNAATSDNGVPNGSAVTLDNGWGNQNFSHQPEQTSNLGSQTSIGNMDQGPANIETKRIPWGELRANMAKAKFEPWLKEPALIKNVYKESEDVTEAFQYPGELQKFRKDKKELSVSFLNCSESDPLNSKIPFPIWRFEQAWRDYPSILNKLICFSEPTPIQCQSWPILLAGRDLIAIAQTGTGKTLAFLLPGLVHIMHNKKDRRSGPVVLILSPTRELAMQIQGEITKYNFEGVRSVCIYGGASRRDQVNAIESGVEIVVATPGRLNDLVMDKKLSLFDVSYLVLDEADRMLDMGFEPQIIKAISKIRPDRHTIMTSATWPFGVRRIAEKYFTEPVQVNVGSLDLAATHTVTQFIEIVDETEKRNRIVCFLTQEVNPNDKILIFVSRKIHADQLASELVLAGIDAEAIHGDREQYDRESALAMFRSGEIKVLIGTDLASRGLDIEDIAYVVNHDLPKNMEEYVHRIGRTGRAGRSGISLTLVTREDWRKAGDLIKILKEANQEVPVELDAMARRWERKVAEGGFGRGGRGGGGGRGFRRQDDHHAVLF